MLWPFYGKIIGTNVYKSKISILAIIKFFDINRFIIKYNLLFSLIFNISYLQLILQQLFINVYLCLDHTRLVLFLLAFFKLNWV